MTPTQSDSIRACPKCGAAIAANSLAGLCPNCLVMVTFDDDATATLAALDAPGVEVGKAAVPPKPLLGSNIRYFGDYELIEEIARGGMGVVFKARQTSLNRIVAVKMILGGQLATDADVKRFRTEAESAANLQHPNIVAIHETGEHEGRHYFSMDYVEGKDLAQVLDGRPMPPAQTAGLLKTITEAVHFAHQRGTLHRDLKPHNVLIDGAGQPRITDFGLAKRLVVPSSRGSEAAEPAEAGTPCELTHAGAVMGSPSYMPPEQALGRADQVGPQSDVYSLGAILYQMLTGKPPFAGGTALEILGQVMEREPVRPSKVNARTPEDLETICLKCLEKRPERRYHSARELAEELGRFLNHEPILARPASAWRKGWSWFTRNPWALIGVAAMAGIVLLGFAYGLWERVRFLEGKTAPNSDRLNPVMHVMFVAFGLVLIPGVLFGRWLRSRELRNLPVSNVQHALLASAGALLIAVGLWSDLRCIQLYVWKQPLFGSSALLVDSLPALAATCLGFPLVLCWAGANLIWKAVRRQQANWSGSLAGEEEWMPLQALHYSTIAFITTTVLNLVSFVLLGYLGLAAGLFDLALEVVGSSSIGKSALVACLVLIAYPASCALWVCATRKVYQRPRLVSVFLGIVFAGIALGWFSAPPLSSLPASFVLTAILAGLVGGWVQVKTVKITGKKSSEPEAPVLLSELLQWDTRALAITLAFVFSVLAVLLWLLLPKWSGGVVFLSSMLLSGSALLPVLVMAVRGTSGKSREFFQSMLLMGILAFVVPIIIMGFMSDFPAIEVLRGFASHVAGLAAGCALIHFGKVRLRVRPVLEAKGTSFRSS